MLVPKDISAPNPYLQIAPLIRSSRNSHPILSTKKNFLFQDFVL